LRDIQPESACSVSASAGSRDHRIYGMLVLPFTAGLVALQHAARQHFGTDAVEIDNLQYRDAMVLSEAGQRIVQSTCADRNGQRRLPLKSQHRRRCGSGVAHPHVGMVRGHRAPPAAIGPSADHGKMLGRHPGRLLCGRLTRSACNMDHRSAASRRCAAATAGFRALRLPQTLAIDDATSLHPALLDACTSIRRPSPHWRFQPAAGRDATDVSLISIEQFRSAGPPARDVWGSCHTPRRKRGLEILICRHRDLPR
jgi:hypothetical protein